MCTMVIVMDTRGSHQVCLCIFCVFNLFSAMLFLCNGVVLVRGLSVMYVVFPSRTLSLHYCIVARVASLPELEQ